MITIQKELLVLPMTQIYRLAVLIPAVIVLSGCEVITPIILVGELATRLPGTAPTDARDQKSVPEDVTTSTVSVQETLEDETGYGISGTYISEITSNSKRLAIPRTGEAR